MIDSQKLIKVRNREKARIGYVIPDLGNLTRNYESGETKTVTMDELRKLSYVPGGMTLIRDYLVVEDAEALEELLNDTVEPEYFYTEDEVRDLLTTGTLDQLKDCFDFAPTGVIDLIKQIAVEIKLNDMNKREAIKVATGFDVSNAISIADAAKEGTQEESTKKVRRTAPVEESPQKVRRSETTASGQKIIIKK